MDRKRPRRDEKKAACEEWNFNSRVDDEKNGGEVDGNLNSSPLLPPLLSSTHGPSPRPWSRARHRRGGAWRLAIGVLMGKEWERAGERGKELIGFARRRSPKVRERETETRSKQTKEPAVPGRSLRGAAIANVRVYVNACALSPSSTCESGRSSEGSGKWSLSFSRAGEGKKEKK